VKKFLVPLLCISSGAVLASEISCDYKSNVDTEFMGTISSSKNYNQKAFSYVDDTRKCVVKMDVNIYNVWYSTTGQYIFGPDMTEVDACKRAEIKAKETVLRQIVPEKLNRKLNQNCVTRITSGPVQTAPKNPEKNNSQGSWVESGWKSVYLPVTKGCHPVDNREIRLANGTAKWVYREVCRTK